jgi:ADP-L-glycero-D-manno-heptose 6-epimerase
MRSFVIKGFEHIRQTGKVKLFKSYNPQYKDGCQMRDFIYVKDAVDMTLFFLENKKANGVFNVGSGRARTWLDLANALFSAMNLQPNIEFAEMPEVLRDKYQYFTQADIGKIRGAGYKREITLLEDAVRDYVQNYLQVDKYL